jgi:Family of unknown function (DUF6288)
VKIIAFLPLLLALCPATAETYYSKPPVFSTAPDPGKSVDSVDRFGPVGIGIELHQPAFVMKVKSVEEGSPAAASGKLVKGQIIESINGEKLKDIDPRIQLGSIIEAAEASDGLISFVIKGEADPVVVKIPVLGAYSKTWPLNCPKSDKIVRGFADYLAKPDSDKGFANIGMLFLLSTGEEKDIAPVKEWVHSMIGKEASQYAWHIGYGGIGLCEYYLRTGDKEALPVIQKWVDAAAKGEYLDGWAGRGGVTQVTYGNGHLNAGGTGVVTFLLLAKECGANVDESLLHRTLVHFFRFAGRGLNPYGDDRPENSFVDNGKNGLLAFAMAAAASLTPEGEKSIYARARDTAAMTSFYTTTFMLHGHTGGGIGEIWRSSAMGFLAEKRPAQYRDFMDSRKWHYELSRRFDGSFAILGGAGYDKTEWGAGYALTYTMPRKTLRITGATSKFATSYKLPERPWGTAADDDFQTLDAVADKDGKRQDLTTETLAQDSSLPLIRRIKALGDDVSDDELRRYVRHQDYLIRRLAANQAMGMKFSYMFKEPGARMRPALVEEFARSEDPRVRNAGLRAIAEQFDPTAEWAPAFYAIAIECLKNPDESWFIKDAALSVVAKGSADMIAPHVDLLITYLQHPEQWLQNGALNALATVIVDERCYGRALPAVGKFLRTSIRYSTTADPLNAIRANLATAAPAARKLAIETLGESFGNYDGVKVWEGGQDISSVYDSHLGFIAASLGDVPGGLDVLYELSRQRFPDDSLPYPEVFLNADPSQFGPKLKTALPPIILGKLVPEFVGMNRLKLRALAAGETQSERPGGAGDVVDQLAGLYARAGQDEYVWNMYLDLRNAQWDYHSFDPIAAEQIPWDSVISRYRSVTMPAGMEQWYAPGFDAVKMGWKTAKSPFGQYNGKIPDRPIMKCTEACVDGPTCFAATKVNTLWEKEVLLMRGTFKVPPIKEGYRYRIMVNDGNHPGAGGGHIIYINGKPLIESKLCSGRGSSDQPKGAFITKEFFDDFRSGEVSIAVKTFIRYNDKFLAGPTEEIPQGRMSLHLEEMKLPPMGDELVAKSAFIVPMMSAEWQLKQDPEIAELDPEDGKFRWDGKFVANPKVMGGWQVIGEVADIPVFDPAKPVKARNPAFSAMTFSADGATDNGAWVWSGDVLMDLTRYQALKMQIQEIGGTEYLFIEAGGFGTRNKPGWKSSLLVLKRN